MEGEYGIKMGTPRWLNGKESTCQSLSQEDPLEKEMVTHSVFLPGESHGQRSLAGYSPWGCKELDTTEQLITHAHDIKWEDNLTVKIAVSKEMATHSSTLAWRIPWREEPDRLQSRGLQRVRYD